MSSERNELNDCKPRSQRDATVYKFVGDKYEQATIPSKTSLKYPPKAARALVRSPLIFPFRGQGQRS